MSSIAVTASATGTGTVSLVAPVTNSDRTVTLPDQTATLITDSAAILNIGSGQVYKDASGNLGIGTNSPSATLHVTNANLTSPLLVGSQTDSLSWGGFFVNGATSSTGGNGIYGKTGASFYYNVATGLNHIWTTNGAEKMRIDSNGNLLVGVTSFGGGATIGLQINATSSSSGAYAQLIKNSSGTEIFQMRCNGGLANFSANDANLSDARTKTDIQNAGSYLAKICAIPVRTFKYKDQTDDLLNLGCIAQEVEAIAPELVDPSGFGETPEDGVPLKAIYQTDLQYALMKCIQELKAIVDAQGAEIAALKGAA
jgi:hypothetical protein